MAAFKVMNRNRPQPCAWEGRLFSGLFQDRGVSCDARLGSAWLGLDGRPRSGCASGPVLVSLCSWLAVALVLEIEVCDTVYRRHHVWRTDRTEREPLCGEKQRRKDAEKKGGSPTKEREGKVSRHV